MSFRREGILNRLVKNLKELVHLMLSGVPTFLARTGLYAAVRRRLSGSPKRFEPPGRPLSEWRRGQDWRHRKLVFPEIDLVIEGFPGSANSFLANSLRDVLDPEVLMTSHFHHTVQLKRALVFGVPAVVVVREPLAASNSLKSKRPELRDELILLRWIIYHRFVRRHRGRLQIFLFEEVIADADIVRRESSTLRRLLSREIVGKAVYRRASEQPAKIRENRLQNRLLLVLARSIYRQIEEHVRVLDLRSESR